jgi:hypothetical protein
MPTRPVPAARLRLHLAALAGPPPTDADLLDRYVVARDEAAFAELVRRHGPPVLAVCRRITRHREDAADAFQATFLVLARKVDRGRRWAGGCSGRRCGRPARRSPARAGGATERSRPAKSRTSPTDRPRPRPGGGAGGVGGSRRAVGGVPGGGGAVRAGGPVARRRGPRTGHPRGHPLQPAEWNTDHSGFATDVGDLLATAGSSAG